jgi:hypothetical protein
MVDLKAIGDRAGENAVGEAVHKPVFGIRTRKPILAVSILIAISEPFPAAGFRIQSHLGPESAG